MSLIIVTIAVIGFSTHCHAGRAKRNVSSNGEFSFQIEAQGRVLPVYNHRGRSYVEGHWGETYAIRVFNHTSSRVEAVVTVDGRDVITGKPGDYKKGRGYVISPYDSVLIDGFRQSWSNVAAFRFTDVGDSYAARMGDASNVGVVGVAVFKEKTYRRPKPTPTPFPRDTYKKRHSQGLGTGYGRGAPSSESESAPRGGAAKSEAYGMYDDNAPRHRQGLGTEYGHSTYSPSTSTTFTRASRRPSALLALRYDDREGLIALGVLPRPVPRPYYYNPPRPRPDPFPYTPEPVTFAPPPPPYYWE
jgi:hypothetical protein